MYQLAHQLTRKPTAAVPPLQTVSWNPVGVPNHCIFTITDSPYQSLLEDIFPILDSSPDAGWGIAKLCIQEVTVREIDSLEYPSTQRHRLLQNSPRLSR
jgi:hypothetical protein